MQIIVVNLVEEFEPLPEKEWWSLLDKDEDASSYNCPQCLNLASTRELLKLLWASKQNALLDAEAKEQARISLSGTGNHRTRSSKMCQVLNCT